MLNRLWGLIQKEFLSIWRDPKSRLLIIIPPLIQFLLFANLLTMEVKNINMVIVDYDNTYETRAYIAGFQNSSWFGQIITTDNLSEMEEKIQNQHAGAGLIIPADFTQKLKQNKAASIQLILDGRMTNVATGMQGYVKAVTNNYISALMREQGINTPPLTVITRTWFNPNAIYRWYLLIALICMLSLVVALILTALSVARERENGTFEQLIVSPCTSVEILASKTIPPLFIVLILVSLMTSTSVFFYRLPFTGSFLLFLGTTVIALLALIGIGLFISSVSRTQQQAVLGAFAFMMPAILLSGFFSPIEDMPRVFQYITYLNPIRFFLNIAKGIFMKNMPFSDILTNLIPLILIAIGTLTFAAHTFKKTTE